MNINYQRLRNETFRNMESLEPIEQIVLKYRFGLDGKRPRTYKSIGNILRKPAECVRQLAKEGIMLLRLMHEQAVMSPAQLTPSYIPYAMSFRKQKKQYDFEVKDICSSCEAKSYLYDLEHGNSSPWVELRDHNNNGQVITNEVLASLCYGTNMTFTYTKQYVAFINSNDFVLFITNLRNMNNVAKIRETIKRKYHARHMVGCYKFKFYMLESEYDMPRIYAELLATLITDTSLGQISAKWCASRYEEDMKRHQEALRIEREEEHTRFMGTETERLYQSIVADRKLETKCMNYILSESAKRVRPSIALSIIGNDIVVFDKLDRTVCMLYAHVTSYVTGYELSAIRHKYGTVVAHFYYSCDLNIEPSETDFNENAARIAEYLKSKTKE